MLLSHTSLLESVQGRAVIGVTIGGCTGMTNMVKGQGLDAFAAQQLVLRFCAAA